MEALFQGFHLKSQSSLPCRGLKVSSLSSPKEHTSVATDQRKQPRPDPAGTGPLRPCTDSAQCRPSLVSREQMTKTSGIYQAAGLSSWLSPLNSASGHLYLHLRILRQKIFPSFQSLPNSGQRSKASQGGTDISLSFSAHTLIVCLLHFFSFFLIEGVEYLYSSTSR